MLVFTDSPGGVPLQDHAPAQPEPPSTRPGPQEKPKIVGIYAIQGCGKSTLIERLKKLLGETDFAFFEGFDIIASVVQGGLDAFKQMDEATQARQRGLAINQQHFGSSRRTSLTKQSLQSPVLVAYQACDQHSSCKASHDANATRQPCRYGLREAHRRAEWWLATHFVSEVSGLQDITINHVQGYPTNGHQLLDPRKTIIVAFMRGGEPMALGVSEAFPSAMFVYANRPEEIKEHHLVGQSNLILVDSVVNSGASVVESINHIRYFDESLRIVALAGVIQAEFSTSLHWL
ncbi:hypothetical protein VMCG_04960 [Cytospora schulzeri]|uniref:Phosphoribosyltransferase domain-containing protein n=1 Tax=Cytospora schulzeri TaxID=448051 RepID=A0A423WMA6_9PEZI|nr:hypothetical protein VMCG_04960 [Valsa malicola]